MGYPPDPNPGVHYCPGSCFADDLEPDYLWITFADIIKGQLWHLPLKDPPNGKFTLDWQYCHFWGGITPFGSASVYVDAGMTQIRNWTTGAYLAFSQNYTTPLFAGFNLFKWAGSEYAEGSFSINTGQVGSLALPEAWFIADLAGIPASSGWLAEPLPTSLADHKTRFVNNSNRSNVKVYFND